MTAAALQAAEALRWLERRGTRKNREGMARYGLPADRTYGVSVGDLQRHAKSLGRDDALAAALWDTGWYEARMLARSPKAAGAKTGRGERPEASPGKCKGR